MKCLMRLFAALVICSVSVSFAQEAQDFPKAGPEHEVLKKMEGEWNADITCHVPGQPEMESKGTMTAKMDLNGFFLITDFQGKLAGQDFKGHGVTGYDPFKKKYTGVWVDSMSPGLYDVSGEVSKDGAEFRETMEGPGPDGKPMKFRSVTTFKSKDEHSWTMYMAGPDGKEIKMMETKYTRKK
jgi:hypothetical protein